MNIGQYAQNRQYMEAIALIKKIDDVIFILALAYENESYDITAETQEVADLLVEYTKENFLSSFIAHIAVNISENKNNIATYFMNEQEAFTASIIDGENPCIGIYEKLSKQLYVVAIQKSNGEDDEEIIRDYLEYDGYILEEFKEENCL